jgi:anti-sigma regulatory factor (Ser/Thr protein kinase)
MALRARWTVPGLPEQVAAMRAAVASALGRAHPCRDAAVLVTSELVTNSVVHSLSRRPGGTVTVAVADIGEGLRIEVTDDGAPVCPALWPALPEDEGGRGLQLVDALAARWASHRDGEGKTVTWAELDP